jgi:hypothetical protein
MQDVSLEVVLIRLALNINKSPSGSLKVFLSIEIEEIEFCLIL